VIEWKWSIRRPNYQVLKACLKGVFIELVTVAGPEQVPSGIHGSEIGATREKISDVEDPGPKMNSD
jgi:hypothetical protein